MLTKNPVKQVTGIGCFALPFCSADTADAADTGKPFPVFPVPGLAGCCAMFREMFPRMGRLRVLRKDRW